MNTENIENNDDDDVTYALRELVRTGRVLRTKDDEGRDVYTLAPSN